VSISPKVSEFNAETCNREDPKNLLRVPQGGEQMLVSITQAPFTPARTPMIFTAFLAAWFVSLAVGLYLVRVQRPWGRTTGVSVLLGWAALGLGWFAYDHGVVDTLRLACYMVALSASCLRIRRAVKDARAWRRRRRQVSLSAPARTSALGGMAADDCF
jgi:hypothetical protein